MLIAAMILGLVGGLCYFIGGSAGVVADVGGGLDPTPWWAVALVPIGVIGTLGGAMVRWRSSMGGMLMLLAGVSALAVGIASAEELLESQGSAFLVLVSVHPFIGSVFYIPPLIALIVGGALALGTKKGARGREYEYIADVVVSVVSTLLSRLRRRTPDGGEIEDTKST